MRDNWEWGGAALGGWMGLTERERKRRRELYGDS